MMKRLKDQFPPHCPRQLAKLIERPNYTLSKQKEVAQLAKKKAKKKEAAPPAKEKKEAAPCKAAT